MKRQGLPYIVAGLWLLLLAFALAGAMLTFPELTEARRPTAKPCHGNNPACQTSSPSPSPSPTPTATATSSPSPSPTSSTSPSPTNAPTPTASATPASSGYGMGIAADDLANTQIGGTDNGPTTRVAYRFITAGGNLTAIHVYFETGTGYSGGTGGSRRIDLTTDSGTVLATTTTSGLTRFPVIPLSASLAAGTYRIVFTNTDPNASANFVSANALFMWDVQQQPKYPGWQVLWDFGQGWQVRPLYLPILQLDGLPEGIGYMEGWQRTQPLIGGNAKVRERFTPSQTRNVTSAMVRLSRTGTGSSPLTVSIMAGATTVASGVISATTFPVGVPSSTNTNHNGWGTVSLNATLNAGTVYDLLLTSPSDTTFHAEAIRQGSDYGFSFPSIFTDGRMQSSTDGTTFTDLPAPYGGNDGQGDLQFWFTTTSTPSPTPTASPASGFVQRNGTNLTLNGQPYRFVGFNIYNVNSINDCAATADPAAELTAIGNVQDAFRGWYFPRMSVNSWARFDRSLGAARAANEKVVVTLTNQWGDCETSGYKSESWYQTGYKTTATEGGFASYRAYVQAIVTRYKNEPAILMWQMVNEAEASHVSLKAFATDIGGLIKSIDTNHLVSIGTIGSGQNGASGADFQDLHSVSSVDICEYHDYASGPIPGDQWNGLQVRIDQCNQLGKPLFVGETGIARSVGLTQRASLINSKLSAQFGAGVDGVLLWDWKQDPTYNYAPGDPVLPVLGGY